MSASDELGTMTAAPRLGPVPSVTIGPDQPEGEHETTVGDPSAPRASVLVELAFMAPLIGWPQSTRFELRDLGPSLAPFSRMVSLDQPGLEFVAARPGWLFPDYVVAIPGPDAERLGLRGPEDVEVLALVSRRPGLPPTVNLLGPIVANRHDGRCTQLVLSDSGYGPAVPADAGSSRPDAPGD